MPTGYPISKGKRPREFVEAEIGGPVQLLVAMSVLNAQSRWAAGEALVVGAAIAVPSARVAVAIAVVGSAVPFTVV